MIFVCKNLADDAKKHVKGVRSVTAYLCYPWCTYDHVDVKKSFESLLNPVTGAIKTMAEF